MAKSKKEKKQKKIAKIIADGRVTKKEAKKAAKQGISLARIQKAQTKSFKPGNVFSRPSTTPPPVSAQAQARGIKPPTPPSYSPLVIQGAAQKVLDAGRTIRQPGVPSGPNVKSGPGPAPEPPTPPPVDPMLQGLMDQNDLLQQQLNAVPDYESILAQQAEEAAAKRQADLAAMQQQQALYMEEMAARNAEAERQRLLTSQAQQANMARAGMRPDFSIGGRARADMYGTGGFKRRRRIRPATIAQGIAPTTAAAAGATNGNLLNI